MKLALAMLVLAVFALSLWADYRWRQWMKKRNSDHTNPVGPESPHANL